MAPLHFELLLEWETGRLRPLLVVCHLSCGPALSKRQL